jgi:hypothetical protein
MSQKKPANPLLREWADYLDLTYKDDISADQHNVCQDAFYAGYMAAMQNNVKLLNCPTDTIREVLKERIHWLLNYFKSKGAAYGNTRSK